MPKEIFGESMLTFKNPHCTPVQSFLINKPAPRCLNPVGESIIAALQSYSILGRTTD